MGIPHDRCYIHYLHDSGQAMQYLTCIHTCHAHTLMQWLCSDQRWLLGTDCTIVITRIFVLTCTRCSTCIISRICIMVYIIFLNQENFRQVIIHVPFHQCCMKAPFSQRAGTCPCVLSLICHNNMTYSWVIVGTFVNYWKMGNILQFVEWEHSICPTYFSMLVIA